MEPLEDLSDDRNKLFCIHCGDGLVDGEQSRNHVPTKALLDRPYPENLPVVDVCRPCNAGFSKDEQYLSAFLAAVISGSTSPDPDRFPVVAKTLAYRAPLRERIEQTRQVQATLWGTPEVQWTPESERVSRVIVKNARGHALFELGLLLLSDPAYVGFSPILLMSDEQKVHFGSEPKRMLWAEVGSRLLERSTSGDLQPRGWVEVQAGTYRYAVYQLPDQTLVRMVLRDYFACEVAWNEA